MTTEYQRGDILFPVWPSFTNVPVKTHRVTVTFGEELLPTQKNVLFKQREDLDRGTPVWHTDFYSVKFTSAVCLQEWTATCVCVCVCVLKVTLNSTKWMTAHTTTAATVHVNNFIFETW